MIRFGTDGVRGPVGLPPLDPPGLLRIGQAVGSFVGPGGLVVLGRDTRESGPAFSQELVNGLVRAGALVLDGGIMPTAAVSCAVEALQADAGVVVTASHNLWTDNGVKVLDRGGGKLLDPSCLDPWLLAPILAEGGSCAPLPDPLGPWRARLPLLDLQGISILLDCAHGAAAASAPAILEEMGARLILRGCDPDGRNINAGVGSLHPPTDLGPAELAICLDGDGDRLLLIDRVHGALDGDDLLWMLSRRETGAVVGTVMSNQGLELALGGRLHRCQVGDRYVAEAMRRESALVGGEPSGHLLLKQGPPTSCGLFTALAVLRAHCPPGSTRPSLPLDPSGWSRWPQAHRSVRTRAPLDLESLPAVAQARQAGQHVLVRASGTEPLIRVMVESPSAEQAGYWADRIAMELT